MYHYYEKWEQEKLKTLSVGDHLKFKPSEKYIKLGVTSEDGLDLFFKDVVEGQVISTSNVVESEYVKVRVKLYETLNCVVTKNFHVYTWDILLVKYSPGYDL